MINHLIVYLDKDFVNWQRKIDLNTGTIKTLGDWSWLVHLMDWWDWFTKFRSQSYEGNFDVHEMADTKSTPC